MKRLLFVFIPLFFASVSFAHFLEEKNASQKKIGENEITVVTDPPYPIAGKETHIDIYTAEEIKSAYINGKAIKIKKEAEHYEIKYTFEKKGNYSLIIKSQRGEAEFKLKVDGLSGEDALRVIAVIGIALFFLLAKKPKQQLKV